MYDLMEANWYVLPAPAPPMVCARRALRHALARHRSGVRRAARCAWHVLHARILERTMRRKLARPATRLVGASLSAACTTHLPLAQRQARPTVSWPGVLRSASPIAPVGTLFFEAHACGLRRICHHRRQHKRPAVALGVGPSERAAAAADSLRVEGVVDALPEKRRARLGRASHKNCRHHARQPIHVNRVRHVIPSARRVRYFVS